MQKVKQQPVKVQMTIRVSRVFRDALKRRSIEEWRPIQDIVVEAVERDDRRSHGSPEVQALFDKQFMIQLKKPVLKRADFYEA